MEMEIDMFDEVERHENEREAVEVDETRERSGETE